jgi:hypothetical protein
MTTRTLLEGLRERGATVMSDGADLEITAPPGVLKPRVLDLARRHKAELLQLLDLETRSREYSEPCHTVPPSRSDLIDEITGTAAPCVSCGAYCGELALCAFCCREALA